MDQFYLNIIKIFKKGNRIVLIILIIQISVINVSDFILKKLLMRSFSFSLDEFSKFHPKYLYLYSERYNLHSSFDSKPTI